jgi:hypothetical protein
VRAIRLFTDQAGRVPHYTNSGIDQRYRWSSSMARYILMHIEGTLISVTFVRDILFPFAKQHLSPFLRERQHDPDVLR